MQSLRRKLDNRAIAGAPAAALRASRALARTGQVARSTIELADGDVFIDEMLSSAADTAVTVDEHDSELEGSRELTDDVVDVLPDMTEDAWEAEDVGQVAGDGADWAAEIATEAGERVGEAHALAESAASAAAAADTKADGKNARRRGQTEPDPPEGGWVPGDQWVVLNDAGTPIAARVWNGTAFVSDQILADEILVLGEDGTVSIGNAQIYAPTVIGGEFFGTRFEGSTFELPSVADPVTVIYDDFASGKGPWEALFQNGPPIFWASGASAQYIAMHAGRDAYGYGAKRAIPQTSFLYGGFVELRVRLPKAGLTVHIGTDGISALTPVTVPQADTWVVARCEIAPRSLVSVVYIRTGGGPELPASVHVDDVKVVRYTGGAGKAALDRDEGGAARLYAQGPGGVIAELRDGIAVSTIPAAGSGLQFTHSIEPVDNGGGMGAVGVQSVFRVLGAAGASKEASISVLFNGGMWIDTPELTLPASTRFQGDTDWTDILLRPGFSPQSPNEQPQVMRSAGKLYLRGLFSNTGIVAGGTPTVADMPDGCAPPRNMQVPAGTSSGNASAQIFLSASGTIQIRAGSTLSAYYGFGASVWPEQT